MIDPIREFLRETTRARPAAGEAPGVEMTAGEPSPIAHYGAWTPAVSIDRVNRSSRRGPRACASWWARLGLGIGLAVALGCAPQYETVLECADANGLHVICGFQNPEDLALLPDGRSLMVSQFGSMDGSRAGSLALFDIETERHRVIYSGRESGKQRPTSGWGDPDCPGPPGPTFSPHGIDLARRPDDRLRLLVVNHGGRESIEFFEVGQNEKGPTIRWRGCAIPPSNSYLNDVVNLPDGGLLATHMMSKDSARLGMLRGSLGFATGYVLEWHVEHGWQKLPGTDAPFPNGIELSEDGRTLYLNAYMAGEVLRIDRASGEVLARASVPSPDNSSWARDGRLLVASHRGGLADQMACFGLTEGACAMAFEIVALDPETLAAETWVAQAGPPMGAGTIALDLGDELVIGSFASDRLLRVPHKR